VPRGEVKTTTGEEMLASRSALVTGSLGGIGFATAKALAALSCDITLNGFAEPRVIEDRLQEISASGVRARYHNADLWQPAHITELIETAQQAFGGLDVLVDNAKVRYFGAVQNFAPEHWDEALAVNLSARLAWLRPLLHMRLSPCIQTPQFVLGETSASPALGMPLSEGSQLCA
jgi:NAD(P)-dependent dehydrogenase (short-subunit alcohol dehydrogenase family)